MDIDERLDKIEKEFQALTATVLYYSDAYNKLSRMFYKLLVVLLVSRKINVDYVDDIISIAKEIDEQTKPDEEEHEHV